MDQCRKRCWIEAPCSCFDNPVVIGRYLDKPQQYIFVILGDLSAKAQGCLINRIIVVTAQLTSTMGVFASIEGRGKYNGRGFFPVKLLE